MPGLRDMEKRRTRQWVLMMALATVLVAGVQWLTGGAIGPGPWAGQPEAAREPSSIDSPGYSCARDPSGVPPALPWPGGPPSNYLHTCGSRLYDSKGRQVRITGVNWSGMETGDYVPGGLGERRWQEILDQVASLGYNTIRIPFTNDALEPDRKVRNVNTELNPDLRDRSALEALDLLVAGARDRGLKVILDRHRPTPSSWGPLWYDSLISEERWIADWRMLAARYAGNDTVIGVDLSNEPRNPATWGTGDPATDWRLAAERAGNAVLEANPYLLILVEGIEDHEGSHYWWGGNLQGARTAPVRLKIPNRLVYSPHDYGPAISGQAWFHDPDFPENLPQVWDRYWGYLQREGIAPVVVGEFGGHSVGDDTEGQWQRALVSYLRDSGAGALVWSLNPSWDTGGVLGPDWRTVRQEKQEQYRQMLAAPLAVGAAGVFGRAPQRSGVVVREESLSRENGLLFAFEIANDGPDPLDLSRLELRYWPGAGDRLDLAGQPVVEAAEPVGGRVLVDTDHGSGGSQTPSLRIRFLPEAGGLKPYQRSVKVAIRLPADIAQGDSASQKQGRAGALLLPDRLHGSPSAALYLDGQRVWGREP